MNAAPESEFEQVLAMTCAMLSDARIAYCVGGSVASSRHGVYRSTLDLDLVVDLDETAARTFCARVAADYYVDETAVVDAVRRGASFNLIHLATGIKVDCFVVGASAFRRSQCDRSQADEHGIRYLTAEDSILTKLCWFRDGGEISDRQWQDLLGVMRSQRGRLDDEHLDSWASNLDVEDLLDRVRREA